MSERMNWREAEMVVLAYRAEHGVTNDVDVATLARALGTDVAEVRRLAGRSRRFIDRSGWLSAGVAVAVAIAVFAAVGPQIVTKNPLLARLMPAPPVTEYRWTTEPVMPTIPDVPVIARRPQFTPTAGMTILRVEKTHDES